MQDILTRLAASTADPLPDCAALIEALRPADVDDAADARRRIAGLTACLDTDPALRAGVRDALFRLFRTRRQVRLYAEAGILPNAGFFSEMRRRLAHTLLPEVPDPDDLKDVLGRLFSRRDDARWIESAGEEAWMDLLAALRFDEVSWPAELPGGLAQLMEALTVVSYRIADIGLDPELMRVESQESDAGGRFESPFIAQNRELLAYLDQFRAWWADRRCEIAEDERHLLVLLDQCHAAIARLRRRAAQEGTSLVLTYRLHRLRQHLERCAALIGVLAALHRERLGREALRPLVRLFATLVDAERRKNDLADFWRQHVALLALRVTENAGSHGEHYITETRTEYLAMLRSAALGGIVIAGMAMLKIALGTLALAPMTEALAFSLNYALGFVLIHMLHGTVATKQPAMTANAIAASIGEAQGKARDLEALTTLIARTVRSQLIAILGNVGVALPLAALLVLAGSAWSGTPVIDADKARHLLADTHPLTSGALIYAATAGLCLFLAGLIAGYVDNLAAYGRIGERLARLGAPRRLLGAARWQRLARYLGTHLGALASNFCFGFLLGGTWAVGMLFGLPIDIRHVAFSSAFLGFSLATLDLAGHAALFAWAALGVALIGLLNLAVSFALALWIALRARQVTFAQSRQLLASLGRRLWRQPRQFFLPPRAGGDDLV